jgi:hypothetical protein
MRKIRKTYITRALLLLSCIVIAQVAVVPSAEAVVCARGVYRAGCVGPHGAVVVRRPIHPHHHGCYWRAGVRICR